MKTIHLVVILSILLSNILLSNDLIVVDKSAAKVNQASVYKAPNGVSVVDIVKPNSKGLSHNKYTSFSVDKQGLILNNSTKSIEKTQLAGYIYGNKNFVDAKSANTILNEVTSKNRTFLKGFMEVAGDKAHVVIANPNGIYINGAGFINTNKATITTGNPYILQGKLHDFDIEDGEIYIDGKGLNTTNVNKAKLYAKVVKLNAQIHANDLDIVTKTNQEQNDTIKEYSIDSSLLGGIYANKINLIATSKGVGVNLPIEIMASDDLLLSADGKIVLDKTISKKDIKIDATTLDLNSIYANNVELDVKDSIVNHELIASQTKVDIKSDELINNNAIFGDDITIKANRVKNYNTIYSNNDINLYINDSLINDSSIVDLGYEKAIIFAKNNLNIQSDEIVNNQAILQTQYGAISLVANSIQNLSSDPKIKGEFIDGARKSIVNGTRIATTNIARDRAGYTYNSYNIYTDIMSYEPYTKAKILSGNNLYIDSKNLTNQYSMIFSNNDMFLDIGELSNKSKDIVQLTTTNKHIYLHHEEKKKWYKGKGTKHSSVYAGTTTSYDVEVIDSIDSTIEARNSIFANLDKLSNGMIENKTKEINDFDLTSTKQIDKVPILLELPTNQYGLYVAVAPDKNLDYLVESNPLYANFANYVGSSYFLEKLNYQGDKIAKRLGDAGYETKIVSDQIVMMSGNRFLSANYLDENDQFVALMDNALEYISTIDTQIGKALSNSQIAMLEKDIVWMEEKKINEQVVLVPVIYLANKDKKDATIYAKNIDLQINDSLYNSGTIKADENINIKTASLSNNSGDILAKNSILIDSKDNIINKNGSLMKANNIYLNASNVINQTYVDTNKVNSTNGNFIYTVIGNKSSIKATDGDLVIVARDSIINSGANLEAKNNLFLQTQDGDINLYAIKLENGYNFYFDKGYQFTRKTDYLTSNLKANNIFLQSANDINLVASKLNATNLIDLEAKNNINSLALNKENYKDTQITSKGTFSKKTQRDMSYKQSVESAKLEAKDIYLHSGNDINLQATTLIAKDEKIAYATNSLNILAQIYKEGELHHTSKSSFGGMIKSEYKYENDHLKIKSSQITADNMILDAKTINLESSQIKAKTMEITTDILNMISSKESIYENEFSNKGGILTATIINQGKIEEIVIPSIIEVNDKLIFNKQDITDQLEINNLLKILSSQGDLTIEQINLVKQIVSLQEWYDKTTTLSGMGALIVTAITTYFTAGSGAGLIEGISNAAIKTATQSVIDSVIIQATTSLANSVITGNKLQLDIETIISSAISAGVLSYVNSSLGTNALTDDMTLSDYVKNATIHGVGQGISSEIRDGEFKDGFATGALITVVSDGALQMRKYVKDNYNYVGNGELSEGVRNDGAKVGGSHPEISYDDNGVLKKLDVIAPTGGAQMDKGYLFGIQYENGGLIDKGIEYFAGPHDFMSSWNYQNIDGITYLKDNGALVNTASGLLLIPSVPFALATFTQKYLDNIQDYRYIKKENEQTKQEAINKAKDNR